MKVTGQLFLDMDNKRSLSQAGRLCLLLTDGIRMLKEVSDENRGMTHPEEQRLNEIASMIHVALIGRLPSGKRIGWRKEEVVYGCGYETSPNEFGMFHGPNPSLVEMLEVFPGDPDNNPCIVKFQGDARDVVFRWKNNGWRKV